MPRTCSICNHIERQSIEESLLSGQTFRNIAQRYGTSATALFRHKSDHLAQALVKAHEADEILRADSLIEHVQKLRQRTEALFAEAENILNQAKRARDLKTALAAIRELANVNREARANAALLGQLTGELQRNAAPAAMVQIVIPACRPALDEDDDVIEIMSQRG